MKKSLLLLCLLPMLAGIGRAQDEGARQDINLSGIGVIQPYVSQSKAPFVKQNSTLGAGLYVGYRYLITPNGALEANYSYSRFTNKFTTAYGAASARVYTSMQEASFAYVRTFQFKKFNPFLEGGGGLLFFSPIGRKTTSYDTELTKEPTVLFGGGVAYELSPSWDLRVQYRGQIFNTTDFGLTHTPNNFNISRRYIVSEPAIGFAYHF
jgi:outer membrane immunogenic protein